ncbi:MAG: methyltransferase [Gemmatimonadota bacterium]|nr:MAG: methyltransferase [Gemmatimonadota bacterium]
MANAPAFNRWVYHRISPWIGARVLEVGSGIGNISQFLTAGEDLVLTDTEQFYRDELQRRFGNLPNVEILSLSLPTIPDELARREFDTVVCLNVLEHIEEDEESLVAMRDLLAVGGRLVLLVPALPAIYGTLDVALGHCRRYTPDMLRLRYAAAGLDMRHLEYFNLAGVLGWLVTGRVLRRNMIPAGPLSLYDRLVPLFRLERFLPVRIGQSLIAIGERKS